MTFTPDLGPAPAVPYHGARQPITQRDLNTPTMSFTPDVEPAEVKAAVTRRPAPAHQDARARLTAPKGLWRRNRVWVGLAVLAVLLGLYWFTRNKKQPDDSKASSASPPARQAGGPRTQPVVRAQAAPDDEDRAPAKTASKPPSRRPVHADGTPWLGLGVDNLALEIEGEDLDGKPFKLSDYRGKVVMVDFWGNWCPYCQQMYSYDKKLVDRMANKPFVLLGVNSDRNQSAAKQILQKEQLNLRSWWDGGDTGKPIARQWNISGWPTYYIIDHKGIVRKSIDGVPSDLTAVDQLIDKLVEEVKAEKPKAPDDSPALKQALKADQFK